MAKLSLREKIERGIVRVGEDGQIHLAPLRNPFALKVDVMLTDPEVAKEFIELSQKLRGLGQHVQENVVDAQVEESIKQISLQLDKLSEQLDPVPVESVIQGEDKVRHRYFCECCFIEMTWRNGPRNPIERSENVKLGELAQLTDEELEELRAMSYEDLEILRRMNPVEFRKGRDYFAHLPTKGKDYIHDRGPGVSLAKDIRNYLELVAHRNEWEFEVLDNKNKGRILVQITNKEKNMVKKFLIAPFGQLCEKDDPKTILVTSSQKSGTARRLTIRGLTSSSVDIQATRERLRSGQGDTILVEDFVQTRLSLHAARNANSAQNTNPTLRFDRPPVKLGDAVVEIMRFKAIYVEGTHEIDNFVFRNGPKYSLIDRSDGNAIRTLINRDMYYADRRRIANDFLARHAGLTLEFDDRKEHAPRFGKGLVIFEPKKTRYGLSKTWSRDLETRKVVINPYGAALEKFNSADWGDTLVIFHSRNKNQARYQRRLFEDWLNKYCVDKQEIGLVTLHTSDPAKVRGNMFAYLKQPELEFMISEYPDTDNNIFGDPLEPVEIVNETVTREFLGEEKSGTEVSEPVVSCDLFGESTSKIPNLGKSPHSDFSLQRFLDHETGMDEI